MRLATVLSALGLLATCGCVRKTLEVTSEPAGAQVIINGQPAGTTPVKLGFQHHGVYRIELRKTGYLPVQAAEPLARRLYEIEGLDVLAEFLWPGVIRDERKLSYRLEETAPLDKEKLFAEARAAAAEAERLIPHLVELPAPNPDAKDGDLLRIMQPPQRKRDAPAGKPDASPPSRPTP